MRFLEGIFRWYCLKFVYEDPKTCDHEWEVYSTAIEQVCLELVCKQCAIAASVDDPTEEEWKRAYYAPQQPYDWTEKERVHIGTVRLI